MRDFVFALLLAAVSCNAMADWVEVGSDETAVVYADPNTIEKDDSNESTRIRPENKVKMWSLKNFRKPQVLYSNGNQVQSGKDRTLLSDKEQMEYDCKQKQYRLLFIAYHTEKDGKGGVVFKDTYPDASWRLIAQGSTVDALWKYVCDRMKAQAAAVEKEQGK